MAMGSGQISFNVSGLARDGVDRTKLLKYTLCPAVGKANHLPLGCPFFFATVCVGLNLPQVGGPGTRCNPSSVPLPLVPLVELARAALRSHSPGKA